MKHKTKLELSLYFCCLGLAFSIDLALRHTSVFTLFLVIAGIVSVVRMMWLVITDKSF